MLLLTLTLDAKNREKGKSLEKKGKIEGK